MYKVLLMTRNTRQMLIIAHPTGVPVVLVNVQREETFLHLSKEADFSHHCQIC